MEYISKSELLRVINAELDEAREGVLWTNAAHFKNKVMHLQNFKEMVQATQGINLQNIIEVLHEHKYHHAAEIVEEAIENVE